MRSYFSFTQLIEGEEVNRYSESKHDSVFIAMATGLPTYLNVLRRFYAACNVESLCCKGLLLDRKLMRCKTSQMGASQNGGWYSVIIPP